MPCKSRKCTIKNAKSGTKIKGKPKSLESKNDPFIEFMDDMDRVESDFIMDFRFTTYDDNSLGALYVNRRRSYVFLDGHESIENIESTCTHEAIHIAIRDTINDSDTNEAENMDIEEEHKLMRFLMLGENFLVD